jgi:ferrous iron transport protein A
MSNSSLALAKPGDRFLIDGINDEAADLKSRLLALGVIPGAILTVLHVAPFGDPMQIKIGSSLLSLRRNEASFITVQAQ